MTVVPALVVSGLMVAAFGANEMSHGGVSEAMGLGHHHMMDSGGYHCASHDDAQHAAHHLDHMHRAEGMPHDGCPGGSSMHGSGSMGMNGMGGG